MACAKGGFVIMTVIGKKHRDPSEVSSKVTYNRVSPSLRLAPNALTGKGGKAAYLMCFSKSPARNAYPGGGFC